MDRLESLGNQLSQLTMYDLKSYYNQAKNMVLNVTEMEGKVREATNDEPWGASSTLMQEIAQGTFNFQQFNEIMPCIYSRFMEKEARQWREIYKALQLLEYIIKHGSERVVDDARSHLSTIKMLRNFHYIDEKGKDQGINVRNRAKEIAELLSDLDRVRQERRKAKANRNKYTGTGNDGGLSFSSGGSRYGGFGSDSLGGGSGYGGGYDRDYNGGSSSGFRDDSGKKEYDEYDAGDWEDSPRRSNSNAQRQPSQTSRTTGTSAAAIGKAQMAKEKEKAKAPVKEVDLLGFGDDESISAPVATTTTGATAGKALPASGGDFDDFDDFQSAPAANTVPAPVAKPSINFFANPALVAASAAPPAPNPAPNPAIQPQAARPAFGAVPMGNLAALTPTNSFSPPANKRAFTPTVLSPTSPPAKPATPSASTAKPAAKSNFDDLWSMSLGSSATSKPAANTGGQKSIKDLEREKAQAGIWGGQQTQSRPATATFGAFGTGTTGGSSTTASGGDDLLL